jgi:hypothetical protein
VGVRPNWKEAPGMPETWEARSALERLMARWQGAVYRTVILINFSQSFSVGNMVARLDRN